MNSQASILSWGPCAPRVEDIRALQSILPACVEAAAREVGVKGLQAFFEGYKEPIELQKLAA